MRPCGLAPWKGVVVVARLGQAKVFNLQWGVEFRNGGWLQTFEADDSGPFDTAMKFDSKEETEAFMDEHNWVYMNGGMAKQVKTPLN